VVVIRLSPGSRLGIGAQSINRALTALHMPVRIEDLLVVLAAVREAQTVMSEFNPKRNNVRTLRLLRTLLMDPKLNYAINRLSLIVESPSTVPEEMPSDRERQPR
jgi:homoserine trans-succinylase